MFRPPVLALSFSFSFFGSLSYNLTLAHNRTTTRGEMKQLALAFLIFFLAPSLCLAQDAKKIPVAVSPGGDDPVGQAFVLALKEAIRESKSLLLFDTEILPKTPRIVVHVSTQEPKRLDAIPTQDIDLVVLLGNSDEGHVAVTPRAKCRTWEISDPCRPQTADLDAFRHARDEINNKIGGLFLDYWRNLA
jgi:hypothetical protein